MLHRPPTRVLSAAAAALALGLGALVAGPAQAAAPPNDDFANAEPVSSYTVINTDNTEATLEGGEPLPSCAFLTGEETNTEGTLWYAFTAPASESVTIHTEGSGSSDTQLAVYTGSALDNLFEIECSEDVSPPANLQSRVTFSTMAGQTYFVQVATWAGDGQSFKGPIQLTFTNAAPPPDNDSVGAPVELAPGHNELAQSTAGATLDDFELTGWYEDQGCAPMQATVWYFFVAGSSGNASLDTTGSGYDTKLYVDHTDDGGTTFPMDACEDFGPAMSAQAVATFPVVAGTTYFVAVGSPDGSTGDLQLKADLPEGDGLGDQSVSGKAKKAAGTTIAFVVDVRTDETGAAPPAPLVLDPPSGVTVESVSSDTMDCTPGVFPVSGDHIGCVVFDQGPGALDTVTVLVTPKSEGPFTMKAQLDFDDAMPRTARLTDRAAGLFRFLARTDDPANNSTSVKASTAVVCDNKATGKANTAKGTKQGDILCGLGGADTLKGLGGNDLVFGGDGADKIDGGGGSDRIYGGGGKDKIVGGPGKDVIDGGGGKDTCKEPADTQTSCER